MSRKMIVMTITFMIIVYLLFSSIQVILQGNPEITYDILKYEELPEEVLIILEAKNYDIFEENGSQASSIIHTGKDTYIILKSPKGSTIKVLEVRVEETWSTTPECKYTTYSEEGVDRKSASRIIKISNYVGRVVSIYSSGE